MIKHLLSASLIFSYTILFAQNKTITGVVTSKQDGQPLIGVNIVEKGTDKGATTDIDGKYSLEILPGADTLEFSYLGYVKETEAIGDRTAINVTMAQNIKALNDVVVIGYGTQRKSDLTGAVSTVKNTDLIKVQSQNPVQALQGKVAGVQVTSTTGAPGAEPVVRVRGVGTFNNASPIYVVDGVIVNDISFLNSSDIQTLEVLKDASATAIYGNRGANGVILITTKQGSIGKEQPTITVGAEYGEQAIAHQIKLLNGPEFGNYVNQFAPGTYNNLDLLPSTDWQSLIFNTAPIQTYNISAEGASSKVAYYFGLGYFNQQGIIDKSNYERLTLKLNTSAKVASFLKIGDNLAFAPYDQQNTADATYGAYRAQPVIPPYQADGSYSPVPGVGNPLAAIQYTNDFSRGLHFVGNVYGDLNVAKYFYFHTSFGVDANYNESRNFAPVYFVSPQQENETSDLFVGNGHDVTWLWENTLNYKRQFGRHAVDALAGYTMQDATSESLGASGMNIIGDTKNLWYLNADNIVPTSISNTVDPDLNFSMISYLFRINYTYNDRYLFTATFRRDGSSKFQSSNRYGNFPSFAVGWNIAEEDFMKSIPVISTLKVRASWGIIGNDKISYLDQYALVDNGLNAVFGQNQVLNPGSSYGKTGNPDLKWESTKQTDAGVEVGILNNQLTGEFDYYNRHTDDILVELSTPGYFGNGQGVKVRYNAGSVLNRGFEFNLTYNGSIGQFKYSIGALGSTLHNEVLSVGGNSGVDSVLFGGNLANGFTVTASKKGLPIGEFFGYNVIGVFQNQQELDSYPHESLTGVGDLKYEDVNHDGIINAEDRVPIGSPIPTFSYGFNLNGSYKGFDLSLDFQGETGNKIYNAKEEVRPDLYNFETHVLDYWHGEGTSNTEPRPSPGGVNYDPSNRFIQDGSFMRLRSAILGYTLPQKISSKAHMQQARIYLNATNVFTITKFTGYTPEIASEDVLSNGIDFGGYPVTSIYALGINLTF